MGNEQDNNQDNKKEEENIPLLIWIDKNSSNKENKGYKKKLKDELKIEIKSFKSVSDAIKYLKKIKFRKTFIICSGRAYLKYIKKFREQINEFMICPKTIIFTSDAIGYLNRNEKNVDLYINHSFYNSGGVVDILFDVEDFIKNEINKKYHIINILR